MQTAFLWILIQWVMLQIPFLKNRNSNISFLSQEKNMLALIIYCISTEATEHSHVLMRVQTYVFSALRSISHKPTLAIRIKQIPKILTQTSSTGFRNDMSPDTVTWELTVYIYMCFTANVLSLVLLELNGLKREATTYLPEALENIQPGFS